MNKNGGIQGLRAVAASLVLLQHGIFFACLAKGIDFTPYLPIGFGWMGVSIFFVISGYVMTLCLPQGRAFMVHRVARIYPAFWIAVAASALIMPMLGTKWSIDARSLALLPTTTFNESYAIPYWTLIYEIAFYVVLSLLIAAVLTRKRIALAVGAWAMLIVIVCQSGVHPEFGSDLGALNPNHWILLSPANFMFIAGVLYGLVGQDIFRRTPAPMLVALAAFAFIMAHANMPMPFYRRFLLFAMAYTPLLELARRVSVPRFLQRAGDYSYGLYLTHNIFIHVAMYVMVRFFQAAPLYCFFIAAFAFPLSAGLAFGALEFHFHQKIIRGALRRPIPKTQGS